MKGRLCNNPELDLGHSSAYVIVASGFQVLHLILARALEGRLPGEGPESQVSVGLELEVSLLPLTGQGVARPQRCGDTVSLFK